MSNEKLDKEYMVFRIVSSSNWSEEALLKMSYEKVKQIYKDTLNKRG